MDLTEKTRSLWPKIEIQDGGRPPSWICYVIILDHPRSLFTSPQWPFKFYANPMYSFEDYDDLKFLQIWLEMPIHAPQFWFFWG